MPPPALDDDHRFFERVEDLAVEQLVAQLRVEALDVAVLPRIAWLDVGRLRPDRRDPALHRPGHELGSVVRADVPGHAAQDEQVREHVDDVGRLELAAHPDREAFPGELVDHVQHAELASVVRARLDEVVGPDMVRPLRPQPHA